MADVYQRVSAVGAAVQQLWKEFSGSSYFVRVMGAVLLNSTGGEVGSTAVPANVKGTASTAVIGHIVIESSTGGEGGSTALPIRVDPTGATRQPVIIQSSTGGEGGSTALPLYVVGTGSTAQPIYVLGTITANQGTTGAVAWPVSLASLPALAASTAIIGSLYPSTAVIGHVIADASTAVIGKTEPVITTPTLYTKTTTAANTEYSQAMPTNCRKWEVQARTAVDLRLAFATGIVATSTGDPYMTLKAGDYYYSPDIAQGAAPSTLFFGSASTGVVIEILAWT